MREMLKEFQEFILKGNAFDLAVGLIIGTAFSSVVASLVGDILMPPIGAVVGGVDFSAYFLDITALIDRAAGKTVTPLPSVDAAKQAGHAIIAYGKFITVLINLLIVGFVIFILVKQINRLRGSPKEKAKPDDVVLLAEIRDLLAAAKKTETPGV